ncbi:MAG TPA: hypothetical protein VLJ39_02730 [Tepidisphaeraceae bacterium]|nr:hypothetical protein [Tepidisphaeraceae bacterium]
MDDTCFECPRCLYREPLRAGMRYCPRCGLAGAKEAWLDRSPVTVSVGRSVYQVLDRLAVGSLCSVYRCRFMEGKRERVGVLKVAREERANAWVANEAQVLRRLAVGRESARFGAFVPQLRDTLGMGGGPGEPVRQANVLAMREEIRSPDELYTLQEVRRHFPAGLDARHVAWIWRRVLTVLGFSHANDVVHAAVLPMHVLIEPREHKLILVDWCCAVADASRHTGAASIVTAGYAHWYKREGALREPPGPGLDIGLAARCMVELLGGDGENVRLPAAVEPAIARYFQRCLGLEAAARPGAWQLLEEFDKLVDVLWGPRRFRVLDLPPKAGV